MASFKYPFKGSKTCCHGLVASGERKFTIFLLVQDLMQSGTNLFSDQSPPPITLPALAMHNLILEFFR